MKVLIIPTPPPVDAPVTSGIAKYLTILVRNAPVDVEYVALDPADNAFGNPYTTPAEGGGVAIAGDAPSPVSFRAGTLRLLVGYARQAWCLARVLKRYRDRADLIHVNFVGCEVQTVAARLAGFRHVVTTVHNLPGEDAEAQRWPRRLVERLSFACGTRHIVVSDAVRTAWHQRLGLTARRVTCIYNGMDPSPVPDRQQPRDGATVTFGICARLHPMKGHRVLVEAFETVSRSCPWARLLIAGEGELRATLEAEVHRRGLGDRVSLLGHVNDSQGFMASLDVHVHPSVFLEAMPYAVVEAMFAGIPQIVSDVGGAPEVIRASNGGRVIPRNAATSLAEAMLEYASNSSARDVAGKRARQYACEHLTAVHMAEATAGIYRSVANG